MENRIWRATVEPTSTNLPIPGGFKQEQFYTKTSLAADSSLRNLNREILSASQAYNNTPKPFRRQTNDPLTTTTSSLGTTYTISPVAKSDLQQVKFVQDEPNLDPIQADETKKEMQSQGRIVCQEENMAPKLVHKQYNSPIDLYSMNNIRKTIEAHTELIAPGIKGINFMKPETSVNKQSEVYKLVKEEEEQRRNRQQSSRLSPISGQPLVHQMSPTIQAQSRSVACTGHCGMQYAQQETGLVQNRSQSNVHSHNEFASQTSDQSLSSADERHQKDCQPRPVCCECGQFIVGAFAKIQNRFVHPSCFNCATCGTSLKNTGYFTINEKLYCEIHAKQVAKVLRIKFDFEGRGAQDRGQNQGSAIRQLQPQSVSSHVASSKQSCSSSNNDNSNAVTISTMFANRANSEIRQTATSGWSCGSSGGNVDSLMHPPHSPDPRTQTATSSSMQHQESSSRYSPMPISHLAQQQSMLSMDRRGRSLLQEESSLVGARTPICVHCHARIQGPYILAGKATWCKLCSQNNFQCSSCYRSLLDTGFIEDSSHKYYCEQCFEVYYAPICAKCNIKIKGDCLNALNKQWHPSCFVCGHCHRPFGNSSFYLEDNVPYCERDWNALFTTKCFACSGPIEAGDKWIEALNRNYHSNCFRCTNCHANLVGSTFYCKAGKPYCRLHAR